ncbi:MAG TPA: DUF4920 domain-containing protein [Thermoanaerobaculia bacterium]
MRFLPRAAALLAAAIGAACASSRAPAPAARDTGAAAIAPAAAGRVYGAPTTIAGPAMPLRRAVASPPAPGERIKVEATVAEVCKMKGCWMVLTDGDLAVRTTFKDYGFFVPGDLPGRVVAAEGLLSRTVTPEADARHYAEDAGASPEEIARIVGDQEGWSFVADSVTVLR